MMNHEALRRFTKFHCILLQIQRFLLMMNTLKINISFIIFLMVIMVKFLMSGTKLAGLL
jgi:hypothetical protein